MSKRSNLFNSRLLKYLKYSKPKLNAIFVSVLGFFLLACYESIAA